MSLFDLQDVCIAIGSLATLDLPMVVDLIGIYVLKGPYYLSWPPPPPLKPHAAAALRRRVPPPLVVIGLVPISLTRSFCENPKIQLQKKKQNSPAGRKSAGGRNSAVAPVADEERSAGARRPAGELNNDDVSSNVSNQQEATAQTSSWYWKLAIAKRCRLNKSIRQRVALTLKIQKMTCAMIKNQQIATGSVVEFEKKSALTNKEFSRWTFSKANPAADDLATQNSAATQNFSSNAKFSSDADFIFSTKKLEFLDANQDCCTGNFTSESRGDRSRVQGRFRAVTVELREGKNDPENILLNDLVVGQWCAEIQPKDILAHNVRTARKDCKHPELPYTA
ncbi:hypothetical protein F511_15032 [Dorcoceras hygrometricum]|uniref:Uncharacterized protein n=1 Tax=Dorcoceras hygrometricum TaxID=472368 RepID=A0A2Z7BS39_9LAMI|nr:hypothetical protein F511_15032 [Dorcoceras hygrometricum]